MHTCKHRFHSSRTSVARRSFRNARLLAFGALLLILAPVSVASAIRARDYTQVFRAHAAEVEACGREVDGVVTVSMDIGGSGRLGNAAVVEAATPALRTAGECVLERARAWSYDRSSTGRRAIYRISFARGPFVVTPAALTR